MEKEELKELKIDNSSPSIISLPHKERLHLYLVNRFVLGNEELTKEDYYL